ncbi:enoyl-CoA hydratase/isomerase family protein [Citricoccus sp. GCM10030269]|uniref:enoyl-CoA hydratase/isomerase family protein n=1 Tax=Citricoccus sp. GCM10030269 TaxID=3273388 RepID=UPI00361F852E
MSVTACDHASGTLRLRREGAVAWIILDRPQRRNALSPQMWRSLPGLLRELDEDPTVRVVGLRGAEGTFSAGADLSETFDCLGEPDTGLPRGGLLTAAEEALHQTRKPTLAALEGHCMGGAWMLAGACDLRIATASARIGLTPAKLGIIFPASGVESLVRLVGPGRASYLLLTGNTVTAPVALDWGMLTEVVPEGEFEESVSDLVSTLSRRSQLTMQAHKHLIRQSVVDHGGAVPVGRDETSAALYREVLTGPDAQIGLTAFRQKAAPDFEWSGEEFWRDRRPRD